MNAFRLGGLQKICLTGTLVLTFTCHAQVRQSQADNVVPHEILRLSSTKGELVRWCADSPPSLIAGPIHAPSIINILSKNITIIKFIDSPEVGSIECSSQGDKLRYYSRSKGALREIEINTTIESDLAFFKLQPYRATPVFAISPDGRYLANNPDFATVDARPSLSIVPVVGTALIWSASSSRVSSIIRGDSYPKQNYYQEKLDIKDVTGRLLRQRQLPEGYVFVKGAFTAHENAMLLFMRSYFDEDLPGVIFYCSLTHDPCKLVTQNVDDASFSAVDKVIVSRLFSKFQNKPLTGILVLTGVYNQVSKLILRSYRSTSGSAYPIISNNGMYTAAVSSNNCDVGNLDCRFVSVILNEEGRR